MNSIISYIWTARSMIMKTVGAFIVIVAMIMVFLNFLAPAGTIEEIFLTYFGFDIGWTLSMVLRIIVPLVLIIIGGIIYNLGKRTRYRNIS